MHRPTIAAAATLALLASVACAKGDKADKTDTASNESESTLAGEPTSPEPTPSMTPPESASEGAPTELATAEPTDPSAATESNRVGMAVFDASGRQIGVIDEIIVAEDGTEQAVISVGTFLGLGSKMILVPTLDLALDIDGARYTIAMTAEEIEAAPEYVPAQPQ